MGKIITENKKQKYIGNGEEIYILDAEEQPVVSKVVSTWAENFEDALKHFRTMYKKVPLPLCYKKGNVYLFPVKKFKHEIKEKTND